MADMITRCPKCATAFRVSDTLLNSANGMVRCGSCLNIFNAQDYLDGRRTRAAAPTKNTRAKPATPEPPPRRQKQQQKPTVSPHSGGQAPRPTSLGGASRFDKPLGPSLFERTPNEKKSTVLNETHEDSHDDDESWALELLNDDDLDTNIKLKKITGSSSSAAINEALNQVDQLTLGGSEETEDAQLFLEDSLPPLDPHPPIDAKSLGMEFESPEDASNNPVEPVADTIPPHTTDSKPAQTETEESAKLEDSPQSDLDHSDQATHAKADTSTSIDPPSPHSTNNKNKTSHEETKPSTDPQPSTEPLKDDITDETEDDVEEILYDAPLPTSPSERAKPNPLEKYDQRQAAQASKQDQGSIKDVIANLEPEPLEVALKSDRSMWRRRLRWPSLVLIALAALVVQIAWLEFHRLNRVEPYRTVYAFACQYIGCELPQLIDLEQIQTSNLLVRTHPEVDNALMVDVILENNANFDQPFPSLLLTFSDLKNQPVAVRKLSPEEYLGGELSGRSDMPSQQPIHIGLEIVDPGKNAVSYSIAIVE